jgi:hypothetical protein
MNRNRFFIAGAVTLLAIGLAFPACSKNDSGGGGGGSGSRSRGRETPASDFAYDATEDGTGVVITKYTGNGGKVVVPAKIEGLPVVEIKELVFAGVFERGVGWYAGSENADAITELVIPDSVMLIGDGLCHSAKSLTKVTLPNGLKIIPGGGYVKDGMFHSCKNLTTVNLPSSLESIGSSAFYQCSELANLTIPDSLGGVTVGDYAFRGCGKLPLAVRSKIKAWGYTGDF